MKSLFIHLKLQITKIINFYLLCKTGLRISSEESDTSVKLMEKRALFSGKSRNIQYCAWERLYVIMIPTIAMRL